MVLVYIWFWPTPVFCLQYCGCSSSSSSAMSCGYVHRLRAKLQDAFACQWRVSLPIYTSKGFPAPTNKPNSGQVQVSSVAIQDLSELESSYPSHLLQKICRKSCKGNYVRVTRKSKCTSCMGGDGTWYLPILTHMQIGIRTHTHTHTQALTRARTTHIQTHTYTTHTRTSIFTPIYTQNHTHTHTLIHT